MSDIEFVNNSILEILIPQASDLDVEEVLQGVEDSDTASLIPSIPQRDLLFFDESLPVYAVLRTVTGDEKLLKSRLGRITIALEAHAINVSGHGDSNKDRNSSGSQIRDVIWTGKVNVTEDPVTVVLGSTDEQQTLLLIWKVVVVLGRPRVRLQVPAVLFKASASLQPPLAEIAQQIDQYLPSCVPLPTNILQPMGTDAALKTVLPQLSALNLMRSPVNKSDVSREILPIKVAARRPCRAVPALSSRIRVQRTPVRAGIPSMIGALEIDVPPAATHVVKIIGVDVNLPHGIAEDIGSGMVPRFPMELHARDQVVCLYSLIQNAQAAAQGHGVQTLEVTINVSISVSEECHPQVQVRFKANVDFSGATGLNSRPNQASQPVRKISDTSHAGVKPADRLVNSPAETAVIQEKLGIVVKFTVKGPVYVGEPFQWEVFIMNRSGKQRKLGLSMLHRKRVAPEKRVSSRPTSLSMARKSNTISLAEPFRDDNLLYSQIKSHNLDATQLICLNTDVKIGPLNPGSCFSTDMEFLPLRPGSLRMDAIRLVDFQSNEAVDLRDLPDIIAIERRKIT